MELKYNLNDRGILFYLEDNNESVGVDLWPSIVPEMCSEFTEVVHAVMLALDEENAELLNNGVLLKHEILADFDPDIISALNLPDVAPYTLHISGNGLLSDKTFQFEYRLVNLMGRPVLDWSRTGVILKIGSRAYTILNPIYNLICLIDEFNEGIENNPDNTFRALSKIQSLLPKESSIDGYLREIRVADVRSFTLDVFANDDGLPDARIIPVHVSTEKKRQNNIEDELEFSDIQPPIHQPILPEAVSDKFNKQFIERKIVQSRYAVDEWYVFLGRNVKAGLKKAHSALRGSFEDKIAFLKNPHGEIRESLPDDLSEEEIEEVFFEPSDYSKRVAEIGIWQPKVLPFLRQAKEPWLPPEEIGFIIDGVNVRVEFNDVGDLRREVAQAVKDKIPFVIYRDEKIPATEQVLKNLDDFIGTAGPMGPKGPTGPTTPTPEPDVTPGVLLLGEMDNLDSLGFLVKNKPQRNIEYSIPNNLKSKLKDHQLSGLRWLQKHWAIGSSGALLADDMGLGKTLVCLCFLAWLHSQDSGNEHRSRSSLVIAPTALAENWKDEHSIHFYPPGLGSILIARGAGLYNLNSSNSVANSKQSDIKSGRSTLNLKKLGSHALVISTYETVRDYSHSFGKIRWLSVIMDEAQKVKNPSTLVTEQCKAVASNADFVLALTGTPVENRMADLWSILDACQPGRLRDLRRFCREYEGEPESVSNKLEELHHQLCENPESNIFENNDVKPILRRMKYSQLKGLPKKTIHWHPNKKERIISNMPKVQADAYKMAVKDAQTSEKNKGYMLEAIHRLRSISLHPYQYPKSFGSGAKDNSYIAASARLSITFDILDDIEAKNERALLFVDSRDLQPIIQGLLQRRYSLAYPPLIINGSVSGEIRKRRVDQFQRERGFGVIILSPRAAGVGLTLTSANHVIHLSRWWNPAVEDQCTDRVYRIGQERDVQVHIPMAVHPDYRESSFDCRLDELLENKRKMNMLVLAPTSLNNTEFERFYSETVSEISIDSGPEAAFQDILKSMDGEQFEDWVMGCFKRRGFIVKRTPKTHDYGADAQAIHKEPGSSLAFIIQCKQTQTNNLCEVSAVQEILKSTTAYEDPGIAWDPMVVTNASGFTKDANALAVANGVRLMAISELEALNDLSLKPPWE